MKTTPNLLLAALLLGTSAPGCGDDGATPDPTDGGTDTGPMPMPDAGPDPIFDRPSIDAANAYPEGHEFYEGQLRFLWDTYGIERAGGWPPVEFMLALLRDEPEVFGEQFSAFGYIPDPTDDLPIGFKRGIDDPTRIQTTCALCHIGLLPDGRLWLGAVNLDLQPDMLRVAVNERWVAAGNPPLLTDLEIEKARGLGPGRASAEGSENPQLIPADFPPYYNFQDRTAFTYLGAVLDLRSTVFVTIFDLGAGYPNPREALIPWPGDRRVESMVDLLGSLRGPEGLPEDPAMIAAGRAVYDRERCGSCHHIDDPAMDGVVTLDMAAGGRERYPGEDPMFPRGSIRTDPLDVQLIYAMGMGGDEEIAARFGFIIDHRLRAEMTDGYRVLGLRAIWSNPPYLHNGSVPTLEDLFRPAAERPVTFMRGDFLVDTTVPGNSNQGHEFGTAMSETDRTALAAYLRSL